MADFEFCKTNQKEYDIVVVAALARLAEVPGMEVTSDGNSDDWDEGIALASKVLGRALKNPFKAAAEVPPPKRGKPELRLVKSFVSKIHSHYRVEAKKQIFIKPGETGEGLMPYSEVCMHMKVAGKKMKFKFLEHNKMVQLLKDDGSPFSSPITQGEGGIFGPDHQGHYYYYAD